MSSQTFLDIWTWGAWLDSWGLVGICAWLDLDIARVARSFGCDYVPEPLRLRRLVDS